MRPRIRDQGICAHPAAEAALECNPPWKQNKSTAPGWIQANDYTESSKKKSPAFISAYLVNWIIFSFKQLICP